MKHYILAWIILSFPLACLVGKALKGGAGEMREIKFRAWDKHNNIMFYNIQDGIDFNDGSHYKFRDFLNNIERWDVLQYMGEKDENDNELYEGDIVEFTYWYFDGAEQDTQLIGVIGFNNASFTLESIHNDFFQKETGYEKGEGRLWFGELCFNNADFKRLGNKHENPELLKEV